MDRLLHHVWFGFRHSSLLRFEFFWQEKSFFSAQRTSKGLGQSRDVDNRPNGTFGGSTSWDNAIGPKASPERY